MRRFLTVLLMLTLLFCAAVSARADLGTINGFHFLSYDLAQSAPGEYRFTVAFDYAGGTTFDVILDVREWDASGNFHKEYTLATGQTAGGVFAINLTDLKPLTRYDFRVEIMENGTFISGWRDFMATQGDPALTPTRFRFEKRRINMVVGETTPLNALIEPSTASGATVGWRHDDHVSIDAAGNITALQSGLANVHGETFNMLHDDCIVTIGSPPPPPAVQLSPAAVTLAPKETFLMSAKLTPEGTAGRIAFTSDNPKVATVTPDGLVKGVKNGSATITARSDGGLTAIAKVTVTGVTLKLSKSSLTIVGPSDYKLTATVTPNGALTNRGLIWSSSDDQVVTVSDSGILSAQGLGTAVVTASLNASAAEAAVPSGVVRASCTVKTSPVSATGWSLEKNHILIQGEILNLNDVITPTGAAEAKDLVWKLTDPKLKKGSQLPVGFETLDSASVPKLLLGNFSSFDLTATNRRGLNTSTCRVEMYHRPNILKGNERFVRLKPLESKKVSIAYTPTLRVVKGLTWWSTDVNVVRVSGGDDGATLTGLAPGHAIILVKADKDASFTAFAVEVTDDVEANVNAAINNPGKFSKTMASFCLQAAQITNKAYKKKAVDLYGLVGFHLADIYEGPTNVDIVGGWTPRFAVAYRDENGILDVIIAIRGTDFNRLGNIAADLYAAPDTMGRHKGFAAFGAILSTMESKVKLTLSDKREINLKNAVSKFTSEHPDRRIRFLITGHSLGGAVCYTYAQTLIMRGVNPRDILIYTMGAPKVYTSFGLTLFSKWFPNTYNLRLTADHVPDLGVLGGFGDRPGTNIPVKVDDLYDYLYGMSDDKISLLPWTYAHDPDTYMAALAFLP